MKFIAGIQLIYYVTFMVLIENPERFEPSPREIYETIGRAMWPFKA